MANTPRFAVTYGRTDYFAEEGLTTVFVATLEEVKQLGQKFITVIPDDLEDYSKDIEKWKGKDVLKVTHQDDDTFLFQAQPIQLTADMSDFDGFVSEFYHEDPDDGDD